MKNINLKISAMLVALITVVGSIGVAIGLQIGTTNYFLDTPLPLYDFYVGQYTNSSYFVVNGTNWDNFLVTTNLSYALNTATGALTSGGSVFLKKGSAAYELTPYWLITNDGITIASDGACLKLPNGAAVAEATTTLIELDSADNTEIYGFELDGNAANNGGATAAHCGNNIYVRSGINIYIHDVYSHDSRRMGIELRCEPSEVLQDVRVEQCRVIRNGYNDIEIQAYDDSSLINGVSIVNNYCGEGTGDISINTYMVNDPGADNVFRGITISGNIISNMTGVLGSSTNPFAHMGIKLEDSQNVTVSNNQIYNVAIGICDDTGNKGCNLITGNTVYLKPFVNLTGAIPGGQFQFGIYTMTNYSMITNNMIYLQGGAYTQDLYGIRLESNANNNTVCLNFVRDCGATATTTGFRDLGSSNKMVSVTYNTALNCDTAFNP